MRYRDIFSQLRMGHGISRDFEHRQKMYFMRKTLLLLELWCQLKLKSSLASHGDGPLHTASSVTDTCQRRRQSYVCNSTML